MSASSFKIVENRKYNEEEIRFVVSRDQAKWDHNTIAKAFKRHFGEYWATRNFTRKQVQYIKNTYTPAPGVIPAYTGPIPEFTPSPEPESSPQPTSSSSSSSAAGRRRRQAAAGRRSASNRHTPMNHQASPYWQTQTPTMNQTPPAHDDQQPASPPRKRQRTQAPAPVPTVEGEHGGTNDARPGHPPPAPLNTVDLLGDAFDTAPAPSLEPNHSPGMQQLLLLDEQGPAPLPNYLDIHPNIPVQSIERHRSLAPGGSSGNGTNSGFPTPLPGLARPPYPHPYTHRGAVARDDPHGVWYFDPHDTCRIALGHRHDFGGGVWFTTDSSAAMSLLAMRRTEGIGFMLGVAAAAQQILLGGGPGDLMRQAARVVRTHVPPEVLVLDDDGDGNGFEVPDPAEVADLGANNRGLPPGHFYDPFHRRVVRYDMSGRGQQQQVGDGSAGSSRRPSRQGTAAPPPPPPPPPQARARQRRTATPRNGRPARQGAGAAGPSNA